MERQTTLHLRYGNNLSVCLFVCVCPTLRYLCDWWTGWFAGTPISLLTCPCRVNVLFERHSDVTHSTASNWNARPNISDSINSIYATVAHYEKYLKQSQVSH